MTRRTERVSDLLRAELSDLILREIKDPRIRLVSLTGVEVTSDLRRAVVRVSALGDDTQREEAVEALRTELSHRLRTRVTPELIFELDRGAEHSQKISDLLESLNGRDESS